MHTAARLGFGNMVLILPQRGEETPPDMYAEIWAQERPGTLPPPPMVSGNYYIDESADRALEQGQKYLANTMRAAIRNYSLDKPGTYANMKGYESYEKMTLQPDQIEPYVQNFAKSVVTGTPQMILDRMWELKEIYQPQGFFPHVHFGGMPQAEALKNIQLFAAKVLPEVKSWEADASIDDRFMAAAE